MVRTKSLIQMLRKWQNVADKGHFVVYSMDKKRFMVPLRYLESDIFRELFRLSGEEFGLSCNGVITLPCDAAFMNYVVSIVGRSVCKDLKTALSLCLASSGSCWASSTLALEEQTYTSSRLLK